MAYTRQDLAQVIGAAFEWLIAMDKSTEDEVGRKALLQKIVAFNKVIETLRITIEELPTDDHEKTSKFLGSHIDIVKKEGFDESAAG